MRNVSRESLHKSSCTSIETGLSHLKIDETTDFTEPEFLVKIFKSIRALVKRIFEEKSLRSEIKSFVLTHVLNALDSCPLHALALTRRGTRREGSVILAEISRIKKLINSKGPTPMAIDALFTEFDGLSNPLCTSENHVRIECWNILRLLDEIKEVLIRANGDWNQNFHPKYPEPFTPHSGFINFEVNARSGSAIVTYDEYTNSECKNLPAACSMALFEIHDIAPYSSNIVPDYKILKQWIEKANHLICDHKYKPVHKKHQKETTLCKKLIGVTAFLIQFKRHFIFELGDKNTLENDILEILDDFCFMLHSLRLADVLNPSFDWMQNFLTGIVYAIDQIVQDNVHSSELDTKLRRLRWVAYQLWNMRFKPKLNVNINRCVLVRTTLKADVMTTNSSLKNWEAKFDSIGSKDSILKNCPHDECCICYQKFSRVLERLGDLAILPQCPHLFCLPCLKKTVAAKDTM